MAVYFDHRHKDLKLLLNLLAETSGLPESFRILTLFDKKFQSLWKPQNLRFEEYETVGIEGLLVVGFTRTFRDKLFCPRTKPGQKNLKITPMSAELRIIIHRGPLLLFL